MTAMTLPNGSASGATRLLSCPASVVLPQAEEASWHAERGHTLHRFLRAVLTGGDRDKALALVDEEHRDTASRIRFDKLGADLRNVRCEVAYAANPRTRTARELGVNIGRRYDLHNITEDEIPGSVDVEGERFDGVPVIADAKFGWQEVDEPGENDQLLTYAAAKAWTVGASEVELRIWTFKPDGSFDQESATVDAMAIDSFGDELELAFDEVKATRLQFASGQPIDVSSGPWCRYCRAMSWCPEKTRLARAMIPELSAIDAGIAELTTEQAGAAWIKAKTIEGLLDRVLRALSGRAKQTALPTAPGKNVREVPFVRQAFSTPAALQMLRAHGATESEIASLYRTTQGSMVRETNAPGVKVKRTRKKAAA